MFCTIRREGHRNGPPHRRNGSAGRPGADSQQEVSSTWTLLQVTTRLLLWSSMIRTVGTLRVSFLVLFTECREDSSV